MAICTGASALNRSPTGSPKGARASTYRRAGCAAVTTAGRNTGRVVARSWHLTNWLTDVEQLMAPHRGHPSSRRRAWPQPRVQLSIHVTSTRDGGASRSTGLTGVVWRERLI